MFGEGEKEGEGISEETTDSRDTDAMLGRASFLGHEQQLSKNLMTQN